MCDWTEADYAEYLLWKEAAAVRARSERKHRAPRSASVLSDPVVNPLASAPA
jgi:hypothetical protein